MRGSFTSLSWSPNSAHSRPHSVLQRLAACTPHLSCTVGPRFWKWHGWDWSEPRDWQQPRLPDWLPFRPSAQREAAPLLAAASALASRPLLPWSPAPPTSPGMSKLHSQKVCAEPARASLGVSQTLPAESVRRHAAEGRVVAEGWGPPWGDKRRKGGQLQPTPPPHCTQRPFPHPHTRLRRRKGD